MGKPGVPVARRCTTGTNFYITVRKLLIGKTQLIYLANNVHLVLNTYRCLFFSNCYWEPSMLFDSVEMERFWNLQHSKFVNDNGTKMVDIWNVNKLADTRTKMEVGKLRTKTAQWLSRCHQTKWGRM